MRRARDQQAAIIGAEIERGISGPVNIGAAARAVMARRMERGPTPRRPALEQAPMRGIEAGRPGLVVHCNSSCRTEGSAAAAGSCSYDRDKS